mmetsp:Transcript_136665/g.237666  ORF Transcript_136665/g.237666 Transcript_136665/m.237666 type:complete len:223 (-) Transcript_136665:84-752(-)
MWTFLASASAGWLARATCDLAPKISWRGKTFKLSFCVQSVTFASNDGQAGERPFVAISSSDKEKKTELGAWSPDKREWRFREVITLEVSPDEEVSITVFRTQQVNLGVAALEFSSNCVGEVAFPVSSVLPRLKAEDRDIDGLMYTTQIIAFDILKEGAKTGRLYISMETKSPPPAGDVDRSLCGDRCNQADPYADTLGSSSPLDNMRSGANSARSSVNSARY